MNQWANLTNEEVLRTAEFLQAKYLNSSEDLLFRAAFVKELTSRGLNYQFDVRGIEPCLKPEVRAVELLYRNRYRFFFRSDSFDLLHKKLNEGSEVNYPCFVYDYEQQHIGRIRVEDIGWYEDPKTARSYPHFSLRRLLDHLMTQAVTGLEIDVSYGSMNEESAWALVQFLSQYLYDKLDVRFVCFWGLQKDLAEKVTKRLALWREEPRPNAPRGIVLF